MADFIQALRSRRVLLMDGAMGTQIQAAGIEKNACYEAWNLTHPEKVKAIHRAYVKAGATVLLSNTFQANPAHLARHHLEEQLTLIIEEGLRLARSVVPPNGFVLAAFGPLVKTTIKVVRPMLAACSLADGILLETLANPSDAAVFAGVNRSTQGSKKPLLVAFNYDAQTQRTLANWPPEYCARAAAEMGANAVGVNCGINLTMEGCAAILREYWAATSLPLFARPNAGTPTEDGKYVESAEKMAASLPLLLQAGAVMVGGCCGTTPEHIAEFGKVVIGE
jgi:5-methyltetrahydrofolate--homocysteine methyltransferase